MNSSKKILPITQLLYRQAARNSSSGSYPVSSRYANFLAKRSRLENPDQTPIHIKYGFGDKVLAGATWALAVVGTGFALEAR